MPTLRQYTWHGYATFGVQYATEAHPTLSRHLANPYAVIELWAPNREMARRIIVGLTMTYNGDGQPTAAFSEIYDWPRTQEEIDTFNRYYPDGVSMIVDCKEL